MSKKKRKNGPKQNPYEKFSKTSEIIARRIAPNLSDAPITGDYLGYRTIDYAAWERRRAEELAAEIAAIAAVGRRGDSLKNNKKSNRHGQKRLPHGFTPPPSALFQTVSSPSPNVYQSPLLDAIQAYAAAQPIADRIKNLSAADNPQSERDDLISVLAENPSLAIRAGHLLELKPNVTSQEIVTYVRTRSESAILELRRKAIHAYAYPTSFEHSPEVFWQLLQRAALIFGHFLFEVTEEGFIDNAKNKFLGLVESRTKRELRLTRAHKVDIFKVDIFGNALEMARSVDSAFALSNAGYYPFQDWKPGFHEEQNLADQLNQIRELEAANKVIRWLILVEALENPPRKPTWRYSFEPSTEQPKGVPQPRLTAMAQEAAMQIEMDSLDVAAHRLGLSIGDWAAIKRKHLTLAKVAPVRDPDMASSSSNCRNDYSL